MVETERTPIPNRELIHRIYAILAEKGPSHTTMDLLARELSISKRTLYEIFGSKDDMIKTILLTLHKEYEVEVENLIRESSNVMEALAQILFYYQQKMRNVCANYYRDMDLRYSHLRPEHDESSQKWVKYMNKAISLGIRQGVFIPDANYDVVIPLIRVQMESLKRMEEFFPPEITLIEAYNAIALGLLRSIATEKGRETLEKIAPKFK